MIVIVITIFHKQFAWLADFLISPGDNLPDPSKIDLPVVNQYGLPAINQTGLSAVN